MNIYPSEYENFYRANPITLVDVGAGGGIMPLWEPHRKYLRIFGFEPDYRAFEELQRQKDKSTHYFNVGLHRKSDEISLYLNRAQRTSSCFIPNRELLDRFHNPTRYDVIKKTTIRCRALDNFEDSNEISDVDFIKLDTQGSELAILEGASNVLKNSVFGLEIEIFFNELYKETPLFSNIDLFVRQFGFNLIDMRPVSWKRTVGAKVGNSKGQLMFADTLYFLQPQILQKKIEKQGPEMARSKLLRAISICQIYGFLDYGIELLDVIGPKFFREQELEYLISHIKAQAPLASKIPNFPGRNALATFFDTLARFLAPRRFKTGRKYLGNF